jgi:hypothetical protein
MKFLYDIPHLAFPMHGKIIKASLRLGIAMNEN